MDNMFWIFVGFFVLSILSSLSILFAIVYFGVSALRHGEEYFNPSQNDKVTPLLGVVHPNKKG